MFSLQIVVASNHDRNNTFPAIQLFPVICWPAHWKCIVHFARKWISCWENGPQCEDHWINLSQSDQCTVAYFLLIDRWASRCCVAAHKIGLNGCPAKEREAVVWTSNNSLDVWHSKLPHYFICITSLVSERGVGGRDECFLSHTNLERAVEQLGYREHFRNLSSFADFQYLWMG